MPLDNTNADPETRAVWVNLARKFEVPIRCVLFTASAKVCEHNDTVRALNLGPEVSVPTLNALRCAHKQLLHAATLLNRHTTPKRQLQIAETATTAQLSC
jgi:predicted kinase